MDPYSAEGELINLHNHFHQGQLQEAADYDVSALSPENALPARVLQLRARIALGQAEDVLADVEGEEADKPELAAVGALARFSLGQTDAAVAAVEKLAAEAANNAVVQVVGGTVLQAAGKTEEAVALLSQHTGSRMFSFSFLFFFRCVVSRGAAKLTPPFCFLCSVDAVALLVQIHLAQNRNDLALKEVKSARSWAQDSLLVNLAESWVGLRKVRRVSLVQNLYHAASLEADIFLLCLR